MRLVLRAVWRQWVLHRDTFFGRAQEPRPLAAVSAVGSWGPLVLGFHQGNVAGGDGSWEHGESKRKSD